MIGDLVVKKENADLLEEVALEEAGADNKEEEGQTNAAEAKNVQESAMIEVTEANIAEYTIEDVVMPMVGHSVRMPPNSDLATIYADLL